MFKHCVIVFFVSMVPLIELRGAIPYGVAFDLPLWLTYLIAIAGNMLPVPIIYFFARKVLVWGRDKRYIGKFFTFCLEKGEKAGRKLQAKAGRGLYWALLLFVGIPLPGTGAWTGTLAASLLDMDFKKSTLACAAGVLLAGAIMGGLSLLGVSAFGGEIWLAIAGNLRYNVRVISAGVMELVDVVDSKSTAGDSVPVRVRSPAPKREAKKDIGCKSPVVSRLPRPVDE